MLDKETINSRIDQYKKKAKRHCMQALAAWMLTAIGVSVTLYHADFIWRMVDYDKTYHSFVVPLIVLPVYFAGIIAIMKVMKVDNSL